MAVMTSEASEGVAFEQKTQPVPSSDKMALDLDINGTSNRHETNLDLAPPDLSLPLNQNLATSSHSPLRELSPGANAPEINGTSLKADAFSSNNTLVTSDPAIEAQTTQYSSAPAGELNSSELPGTGAPVEKQETTSDLFDSAESAVDAAVEDHTGISTMPPIIDALESDLRDTSISLNALQAEQPILENTDTGPPLRPVEDMGSTPIETNDVVENLSQTSSPPTDLPQSLLNESVDMNNSFAPEQHTSFDPNMGLNDSEMADAPQPSAQSSKLSREREDDDELERSAKRTKTEDGASDLSMQDGPVQNGDVLSPKNEDGPITPHQGKEIVKVLKNVLRTQSGRNFRAPVVELWPNFAEPYAAKVPNPIDLGTIEKKVKENIYSTYDDFAADITLLSDNAVLFNGLDHPITKAAQDVHKSILEKTRNLPREVVPPPKPAKKVAAKRSTPAAESAPRTTPTARRGSRSGTSGNAAKNETFALDPSGIPVIRRDSNKVDGGRPKREIHPPKNKDLPYSSVRPKSRKNATELKFCDLVLSEMKKPKYGQFNGAFLVPVDPVALGIPNYFSVIKNPMDLQTITNKLVEGHYPKAKDFETDVRLMLSNCFKFNPPGNPVHDMGKDMERLFEREWQRKSQWISDHTPAALSPSSTADTEEEESDEDVEPEAAPSAGTSAYQARLIDEQAKLIKLMTSKNPDPAEIQMQQEIVNMIQGKVDAEKPAVPKKVNKKSKAATSKPVKKSGPTKRAPAASGTKKSGGRARYMGTIEKEVVSAGIGLLPDHTQERVMELIRGDAPGVEADDDGSLELDIETLTEPTLAEIYDMIIKYLPDVDRSIRKQKDQERVRSRALAQPKQKKKNKPMSKNEQERKIEHLKNAVQEFERHGSGSQEPVMPTVEQQDETSGDESSDSEEE